MNVKKLWNRIIGEYGLYSRESGGEWIKRKTLRRWNLKKNVEFYEWLFHNSDDNQIGFKIDDERTGDSFVAFVPGKWLISQK